MPGLPLVRLSNLAARVRRSHRPATAGRRRLLLEPLEPRRLLAATDLASIRGLVFRDLTGDGFTAGDQVAGAAVTLYRDTGDGVFQQTGDTQVRTVTTAADGRYRLDRLTAGSYFVLRDAQTVGGAVLPRAVSPLIVISATAVTGRVQTVIDGFDTTTQSVVDTTNDGVAVTSAVADPDAIGGERDLFVNKTSVNGAVQLNVDNPLLPGVLTFDSVATGDGQRRVIWDGVDGDAATISDGGLGAIDLTAGGEALGLQLQIGADLPGGTAVVRLYTDDGVAGTASRLSTATLAIPQTGGAAASPEFLPFSSFVAAAGGGVDPTRVGAIELEIAGAVNVNGVAELVGTVAQTVFTADFASAPRIDLSLAKTVNNAAPGVGQNVTFTLVLANSGPDAAGGVTVRDVLPAGLTLVSSDATTGSYDSATGLWTVGNLAAGGNATLTLVVNVTATGTIINTAEVVSADQPDADSTPGNGAAAEDDQASVTLQPTQIDLSLTKIVDNAVPSRGENVTFTITVANAGPSTATGVVVRDVLPVGLTFVSATPGSGSFNSTTGLWSVGVLAPAATATLQLTARVNVVTPLTNTAEVFAAAQGDIDSTPANGVAGEDDQAAVVITPSSADLSITKTVDVAAPNVGQEVTFTVTLRNDGPNAAGGVVVTDRLPAGITLVRATPSLGTYDAVTGLWQIPAIAAGDTIGLTIVARVDSRGAKTNTAAVTASDQFDPDSTPGNNVAGEDDQAAVVVTPPEIDLSLTKTVDVARPNQGETIRYTIGLANAGPATATGVVVRDRLPAGLTVVSATTAAGVYDSATGLWTVPELAAGTSVTLLIDALVETSVTTTNTAEIIAADQVDTDSTPANQSAAEDDIASVQFTPASADLSLTKSIDNPRVGVGDNVTFTIRIANAGPDAATGVTVRDVLPAGLRLVSATPAAGTYDAVSGLWTLPTLANASAQTLTVIATAETAAAITNVAEIITSDQRDPDSTPGNAAASEDDIAAATLTPQQIDLSLTKSVDNATPRVGDEITFTLTLRNDGVSDATGVLVRDVLPAGLSLRRSQPTQGSFNTTTGVWNAGQVDSGATAGLQLVARVDRILDVTNVAQVIAAAQPDIDSTPDNNNAAEDDQAGVAVRTPIADLSLVKSSPSATPGTPRPNAGDTIVFELTITNDGPDDAGGVVVTDVLPPGFLFVSTSLSQGAYDATTGRWTVGTLPNGSVADLSILGRLQPIAATPTGPRPPAALTNTAEITAADQSDSDSTPGNNVPGEDDLAAVTVTPAIIDLALTKSVSDTRPSLGDRITYNVVVTNDGVDPATDVIIRDMLPPGVTLVDTNEFTGSFNAATGLWSIPRIDPATRSTLELTVVVDGPGTLINRAEVIAADQFDSDSTADNDDAIDGNGNDEDDQAAVSLTVASADLSLTKTVDDLTPGVGSPVTYVVTLANAGPDPADDVVVRDLLPTGMRFVTARPQSGTYDVNTGRWAVGSIAVGQSLTLEVDAVPTTFGPKVNVAQIITSSQFDPDSTPGNDDATEDDQATVTLTPELVDLALTKSADVVRPNVGDTIRFLLRLTNAGPSTATGVAVADRLPAGLRFVSASPSQGTYSSLTGVWTVGTVATTDTPTLEIQAVIGGTGNVTNVAEVTAADQPDVDSTPDNAAPTEDDRAAVAITTQAADLSLAKTVDIADPEAGDPVTFTLRLRNSGPDAATGVVIADALPPGLTLLESDVTGGVYDAAAGRWSIDSLPTGGEATLRILARVTSRVPVTNVAQVIDVDQFDPDSTPGNNVAAEDDQAAVVVTPRVIDVSVAAMVDNQEPLEGDIITLTFTAANAGPADATGLQLRTLLPAGLTLQTVSPQRGTYDPVSGLWDVGNLAAGEAVDLVFQVRVDQRGLKQMPIEVIAADQIDADSDPGNGVEDEDDQTTLLIRAPRLLTKRLFLSR